MSSGLADSRDETRLTNLRFADDVLVIGRSLKQVTEMLTLLKAETGKCGLELHPEKTKILSSTNRQNRPRNKFTYAGDMRIEILPRACEIKYLGRQITFGDTQAAELKNQWLYLVLIIVLLVLETVRILGCMFLIYRVLLCLYSSPALC